MDKARYGPHGEKLVSEALAESIRSRIVAACGEREITRREFAEREGFDPDAIKHHFDALVRDEFLQARLGMARGLRCNFYTAARSALFTDREFSLMDPDGQYACTRTTLSCFRGRFARALSQQALDARHPSHVSYGTFSLDDQGFRELADWHAAGLEHQQEIQARARVRLRARKATPIPVTAGLFLFESSPEYAPDGLVSVGDESSPASPAARRALSGQTMIHLLGQCARGLRTRTIDSRDDSHVSWAPLLLDDEGFGELDHGMLNTRSFAEVIERTALARLRESGEAPILTTIGFVAFESPPSDAPKPEPDDEPR